ncbi:MAG TPA: protein kinase, partial [Thermoanaerobaculia bacterium]|nr:protein kinase [Thermoanaerobaculia bacterium]
MSPNRAPASFPPVPDRYAVIAQVGRGASGTVFKARDRVIGRFVALKRLDLSQAADEEERETLRQRFVREAQTAGRLAHRNVVTVYDVVKDAPDGATLLVMEWVEGESLKSRLTREKPLPPELVVDIASQVAEGL